MKLYDRLFASARTTNLQNLLHIRLENWLTPKKFNDLKSSKKISTDRVTMEWLKKLSNMFDMAEKPEIETYDRVRLHKNICLYTDKSSKVNKSEKNLVLCMTGTLQRMMMPLPVFLQHFDAKSTDVVLIKFPKNHGYCNGLAGVTDDFDSSFDVVYKLIDCQPYARKVSFGVSAGALPALLVGLKYSFDSIMSVGPGSPYHERWAREGDGTFASNYIKKHAKGNLPSVYLVHGKADKADTKSVDEISSLISAKKIVISSKDHEIGHICLPAIVNSRKLRSFLDQTLFNVDDENKSSN